LTFAAVKMMRSEVGSRREAAASARAFQKR
jgi:hypothetical protein